MFSIRQKREISESVQKILRDTNHPELPSGEIGFLLHVQGESVYQWADIRNNCAVVEPSMNPHNEAMGKPEEPTAMRQSITPENKAEMSLVQRLELAVEKSDGDRAVVQVADIRAVISLLSGGSADE